MAVIDRVSARIQRPLAPALSPSISFATGQSGGFARPLVAVELAPVAVVAQANALRWLP